ncbi:MAG TPA: S8 family serine peptidase [Candidatus Dormibacteraeota bacterium]|nr:S8 family serine peptidase [Candidatus Dormibacteraeota bacterium]
MKRSIGLALLLSILLTFARPAVAALPPAPHKKLIVRTVLGPLGLQGVCFLGLCKVVQSLDGTIGQLFLLDVPGLLDVNVVANILSSVPGILNVEVDRTLSLRPQLEGITFLRSGLWQQDQVNYAGTTVWSGYMNQPPAQLIGVDRARSAFNVSGSGIVADIDTGVDPNHPALRGVLLPGYDFTRNQPGASELLDLTQPLAPVCGQHCQQAARVNQSTAAMLDQSTAAMLDGTFFADFGHGTEVVGVVHLVAPTAKILPLKAFRADGTGNLSDILRAIYYAVQNRANVINMSFDFTSYSKELDTALSNATQHNVICVASAGNNGRHELVYPAALSNVMGIASTSDFDTRSYFSNYGADLVWITAPGEQIITTYPFSSYAVASGTSFSSPFVSGSAALLLQLQPNITPAQAALVLANAKTLTPELGNGRLDIVRALQSIPSRSESE